MRESIKIASNLTQDEILIQTMEECAELIQAICKHMRRFGNNTPDKTHEEVVQNLNEEIADVKNCLEIIAGACEWHDPVMVKEIRAAKMKRWFWRLTGKRA